MAGDRILEFAANGAKPQTLVGMVVDATFEFCEDKLFRITVNKYIRKFEDRSAYAQIMEAYAGKYGPPDSVQVDTYQNGFGAVYHGETSIWLDEKRRLSLIVIDSHQESVMVRFTDMASRAAEEKPIKKDDL